MTTIKALSTARALILASLGLLAIASGAVALADDQPADGENTATPQNEKIDDSPGELFPGVRGVSGSELTRRIAELEKRKKDRTQPSTTTPAATPGTTESPQPAAQPAGTTPAATPAATDGVPAAQPSTTVGETPAATTATGDATATEAEEVQLTYAARMFLKQLDERVERIDLLLRKAREYRTDAETAAARIGNEEKIQYYLRTDPDTALTDVRNYEKTIKSAISVYRTIYEMTRDGLKFAVDKRPADDLGAEGVAATDKNVTRLKEARRECLVAAAELFTKIRRFDAAERIYAVLSKMYPNDGIVSQSYSAMIRVRDEPMEFMPFGERGMGGMGGRRGGGGR